MGSDDASSERVVVVGPLPRLVGADERERQRADAALGSHEDRLPPRARHPHRRMRTLQWLRHHVAGGIEKCLPAWPRYGASSIIVAISPTASSHISRLAARSISKPASSMSLRRLARAELDAAVGHEVERRDPLGDAGGMVVTGRHRRRCRAPGGCSWCAGSRRRGTPRARTSGCTPRGSGARPPTPCRTRVGPRARPARAPP